MTQRSKAKGWNHSCTEQLQNQEFRRLPNHKSTSVSPATLANSDSRKEPGKKKRATTCCPAWTARRHLATNGRLNPYRGPSRQMDTKPKVYWPATTWAYGLAPCPSCQANLWAFKLRFLFCGWVCASHGPSPVCRRVSLFPPPQGCRCFKSLEHG